MGGQAQGLDGLLRDGRLAGLSGPREDLEKSPRLAQARDELIENGTAKLPRVPGHDGFLNTLSNFTQDTDHSESPRPRIPSPLRGIAVNLLFAYRGDYRAGLVPRAVGR